MIHKNAEIRSLEPLHGSWTFDNAWDNDCVKQTWVFRISLKTLSQDLCLGKYHINHRTLLHINTMKVVTM